jgi:hypothetical protein
VRSREGWKQGGVKVSIHQTPSVLGSSDFRYLPPSLSPSLLPYSVPPFLLPPSIPPSLSPLGYLGG